MSDLDRAGININTIFSGEYTAETIATLSAIFVENGTLEPAFHPTIEHYILTTDKTEVELSAIATSSRAQSIRINSQNVTNKKYTKINIAENKEIHIHVIAPNGVAEKTYTILIK